MTAIGKEEIAAVQIADGPLFIQKPDL